MFSITQLKPWMLIALVAFYTLFFPLISMLILKGLGFVKSFYLEDRNERIGPYIVTFFFFFLAFYTFRTPDLALPRILPSVLLGAAISVGVAFFINALSMKISMHTLGMGCLIGVSLLLAVLSDYDVLPILFIVIFIAGLVGTARLYLKAHKTQEIYAGYLIGLCSMMLAYIFMSATA